ncbi:MAG: VCBS repeat-containing protein [Pseudoxanthomonas sp.]
MKSSRGQAEGAAGSGAAAPAAARQVATAALRLGLALGGLLGLGGAGCEAVYGGLAVPVDENCVVHPNLCAQGQLCNAVTQICQDGFVLSQITPAHARTTAQTPVTLSGENFVPGMTVKWNGVALQPVTVDSPTQLRFVAPISSEGGWRVHVEVTSPSGLTLSRRDLFSYSANEVTFTAAVPAGVDISALFNIGVVPAVGSGRAAVYLPDTGSRLRGFTFDDGASAAMEEGRLTAPPNISNMLVADLNGDGIRDLLLSSSVGYFWLAGNPDSSLQQYMPIHTGAVMAKGMALGDLDHDGRADVVGTDPTARQLAIMGDRGSKYATFATLATQDIRNIVVAELDGLPGDDIAFAYAGTASSLGIVHGESTLLAYPEVSIAPCTNGDLRTGRFGPTTQSLVLTCEDRLQLLQATGGGKFSAGFSWPINATTQRVLGDRPLLADFDNDGDLDMVVVRRTIVGGQVELWLLENGDGMGNLVPRQLVGSVTVAPTSVVDVGDLNDDDKPDLVIGDRNSGSMAPLTVLLNRSR